MSENFLSTLHAKFLQLRGAAHFPDVLHDLISAVVNKVHDFEARLHALEHSASQATPNAGSAAPSSGTGSVLNATVAADPAPAPSPALAIVPPPGTPAANMNQTMLAGLEAGHENDPPAQASAPAAPSAPAGYEGHDLTPGHPRINVEQGGQYAEYRFTGPGTIYYQICAGCDSGMRVTSYIADSSGRVVSEPETRVIMNKQPFPVLVAAPFTFYVKPEVTGPISVGME